MPGAMTFLTWADLSEAQLKEVYFLTDPKPDAPKTCREALARTLAVEGTVGDAGREVLMDLYVAVLAKCQSMQLSYEKTSTFFSIMKVTHSRAVEERLTVDRSFTACKELLLQHSVQRPPYSVAIFTLEELKELSEWALDNYYRYYKMYQYVYTPRIKVRSQPMPALLLFISVSPSRPASSPAARTSLTPAAPLSSSPPPLHTRPSCSLPPPPPPPPPFPSLPDVTSCFYNPTDAHCDAPSQVSITSRHPTDILERAPLLPSLDEAETSEQYQAKLAEEAAAEEARQAAQAEADAAAAEEARKQKIQDEYLAAIPDEIKVGRVRAPCVPAARLVLLCLS